jgi:hypothetical protein
MEVFLLICYFMKRSILRRESKSIVQQNDQTRLNTKRDSMIDSRWSNS